MIIKALPHMNTKQCRNITVMTQFTPILTSIQTILKEDGIFAEIMSITNNFMYF